MPVIRKEYRPRREMERIMTREYMLRYYPKYRQYSEARLGELAPEIEELAVTKEELGATQPRRRWIDGIVITPERVILIEAAIRIDTDHLGKILVYNELFPVTPEFREHKDKPRELQIIYAVPDPAVIYAAQKRGVICIEYKVPWLDRYIETLPFRYRRGTYFKPSSEE